MPHRNTDLHNVKLFSKKTRQDFAIIFYYHEVFHEHCDGKLYSQAYREGYKYNETGF